MLKEPLKFPIDPDEFEKVDLKRDFINPKEFADRLGYSRNTITEWCQQEKLNYIRFGKKIFIYKFEFARMAEEGLGKLPENGTHDKHKKEKKGEVKNGRK